MDFPPILALEPSQLQGLQPHIPSQGSIPTTPFFCRLILALAVSQSSPSKCLTLIGTRLRNPAEGTTCMGLEARSPLAILVLPLHLVLHLGRERITVTPLQGQVSRVMKEDNARNQDRVQKLICHPGSRQITSTSIVVLRFMDSISDLLPNSSPSTANARDNGLAWTRVAEVASVFTQELSKVWATPVGSTADTEGKY